MIEKTLGILYLVEDKLENIVASGEGSEDDKKYLKDTKDCISFWLKINEGICSEAESNGA